LIGLHTLAYFSYVAFAISALFLLVKLGHKVLELMRDFDDYRSNRPPR